MVHTKPIINVNVVVQSHILFVYGCGLFVAVIARSPFPERACRACFLHLFVGLLGDYRDFILFPKLAPAELRRQFHDLFDMPGFIEKSPRASRVIDYHWHAVPIYVDCGM
jgi:hypothetical protein